MPTPIKSKNHRTCPKCGIKIFGKTPKEVLNKYRGHMGGHGKREKKERLEKERIRKEFVAKSGIDIPIKEPCEQPPPCPNHTKPSNWSVNWDVSTLSGASPKDMETLKKKNRLLKDLVMRLLMEMEDE